MKLKQISILGIILFALCSCQQNKEPIDKTTTDQKSAVNTQAERLGTTSNSKAESMSPEEAKQYAQLLEYQEDLIVELKNIWENVSLQDLNNDGINEMVCYNSDGFKLNQLDGRRYKVPDYKSGAQIILITKPGEYKKIGKINSNFTCDQGINWRMKTNLKKKDKNVFQNFDLEVCQDDKEFKKNLAKKQNLPEADKIESYKKVRLFHTYSYNNQKERYELSQTFLDFLDKNNRGTKKRIK